MKPLAMSRGMKVPDQGPDEGVGRGSDEGEEDPEQGLVPLPDEEEDLDDEEEGHDDEGSRAPERPPRA